MLDKSRITAAIWPWGTDKREQMEQAAEDIVEIGYSTFESVKAAIYAYDLDIKAYKEVLTQYNLKPVSFYFHLPESVGYNGPLCEELDKAPLSNKESAKNNYDFIVANC